METLVSMGFEETAASSALAACNNDVDAALQRLLDQQHFSPSPHDVLAETQDPYRLAAKKRPNPVANDPEKGQFRKGLDADAAPAEILDARIAELHAMGFSVDDSEHALDKCGNDFGAALSMLLDQDTGSYFSASPHDVLAQADHPYGNKKKPDAPPNDPEKGHFRDGLPPDAPPAAILDSRLHTFLDMGFSVDDAEAALAQCDNDVNAALSLLCNKS